MQTWTEKEQKKNRKKWVKALRSGKYQQTTHCLRDEDGFCCLGVATDLFIKENEGCKWNKDNAFIRNKRNEGDSLLPAVVQRWLGIQSESGMFYTAELGHKEHLTTLNDVMGWSFNAIADLVESEPEGMFEEQKKKKKKK